VPTRSRQSHAIRRELVFSGSGGGGSSGGGRGRRGSPRVRLFASEHSGGLGSGVRTVNRVVVETLAGGGDGDDASDRSTLDEGHLKAGALEGGREGILWTREVTVEHHDRRDVESLEEKRGPDEGR